MQENNAIFIADWGFLFGLQGKNRLSVLILHFIHIALMLSTIFLFHCQLRFIHGGLNTLALTPNCDFLPIDFNILTIVLLHFLGEVLLTARHGLKERDGFLMRFDYNLAGA